MRPITNRWDIRAPLLREQWIRGELLALRGWHLVRWSEDGGVRLQSMYRSDVWHGPVFRADHKPLAEPTCGSGVYALKASCRPRVNVRSTASPSGCDWLSGPDSWIWGWVALVGQVVEHAEGFRAEGAVVRRLHLGVQAHMVFDGPQALTGLIRELEDRYQCPVKSGYWEPRRAAHLLSLRLLAGAGRPSLEVASPVAPVSTGYPGIAGPAALATARPRPPGPRCQAVVRAFQKAERELGAVWRLKGRGHCRRVSLRGWHSRFVRPATKCWLHFTPHESGFRVIVFPLAVVRRAARILRVSPEVLIGQEFGR